MKLKNTLGLAIHAMTAAQAEEQRSQAARPMTDKERLKLLGAFINMKEAEVGVSVGYVAEQAKPAYKLSDMNGDMGVIQK